MIQSDYVAECLYQNWYACLYWYTHMCVWVWVSEREREREREREPERENQRERERESQRETMGQKKTRVSSFFSILIVPIRDLEAPVRHVFFFLFQGAVWRGVWSNHRVLKNELKNPVDFFLCASTNL